MTEPTKPIVDIPLGEAMDSLTGFEVIAAAKHYGANDFTDLGAMRMTIATVWAYENRNGNKRSWVDVEGMSMRDMRGYFAPDSVEPDDETGKGA